MSNTGEFYDHTTYPVTRSTGTSAGLRQELDLVEAGFNKLPPLSGNALRLVKVGSGGADMTVSSIYEDASGRVLVGTSASRSTFGAGRGVQVESTGALSSISIFRNSNDTTGSTLVLGKSRGVTVGSNTILQSGDVCGQLTFVGSDGTDSETPVALVQAMIDGTPGANDMPGSLLFYTTSDGSSSASLRMKIDSLGGLSILSSTGSIGYGTGAGGTITQATSKATGVTLNRPSGQITMNGAALAAATAVSFTLTNSVIGTTDVVHACIDSAATAGAYSVTVDAVGAGTCQISLRNHTAGSLSEAVVLNFVVLRAATA